MNQARCKCLEGCFVGIDDLATARTTYRSVLLKWKSLPRNPKPPEISRLRYLPNRARHIHAREEAPSQRLAVATDFLQGHFCSDAESRQPGCQRCRGSRHGSDSGQPFWAAF